MKKQFFQRVILVAMAVATAQVAVAESWRINHDQSTGAHFASINEAMASEDVKDGDMLYLDAGCVLSDAQTITKAVTVIGTGWGYSHLPYMPARIANVLYINSAAKVVGVQITNNVYPNHADIVLERCHITGIVRAQKAVYANPNLQVIGCMIDGTLMGYGMYATNERAIGWKIYNSAISSTKEGCVFYFTDCEIVNCILINTDDYWLAFSVNNSLMRNNVILNTYSVNYANNIFRNSSGNSISNNVLSADNTFEYAEGNYCAGSATVTDFIVNTGAGGAAYQLSENSPAKGFGENGIDCGPYAEGSLYPFVTYGMPQYVHYPATMVVPARPTNDKVGVKLQIVNQDK